MNLHLYRLSGHAGVSGDGEEGTLNYMRIPYAQALALLKRRPCRFLERHAVGGVEQMTYAVGEEPAPADMRNELFAMLRGLH